MSREIINCPQCGKPMENLGNVSGLVYTSYPAQWDETHACHVCKVRKAVRCSGAQPNNQWHGYRSLDAIGRAP